MLYTTESQVGPHDDLPVMNQAPLPRLFEDHYRANRGLWQVGMTLSDEQFCQVPGSGYASIQTQIVRMVKWNFCKKLNFRCDPTNLFRLNQHIPPEGA